MLVTLEHGPAAAQADLWNLIEISGRSTLSGATGTEELSAVLAGGHIQ